MTHFHIWCNLKPGIKDRDFADRVREFLSDLHARELIEGYQISRRKFVIAPPDLGKFHVIVDFTGTAQINRAFDFVTEQMDDAEAPHKAVIDSVRGISTALYGDYPEPPPRKKIDF